MKVEVFGEYLNKKLELWHSYHNHKENMSNAGFLVQLSLFGAVIVEALWPPKWVSSVTELAHLATFLTYFMLWFLIHYYMRWQLVNKRVAAIYVASFDRAYLNYSLNQLSNDELRISDYESHRTSKLKEFLSKLIYLPNGFQKMDASTKGLPEFIAKEVKERMQQGTGAQTLEVLMTYASISLMLIISLKVFFG